MKIFTSSPPNLSEGWTRGERDSMKRANRLRQKAKIIYDDPTPTELRQALIEGFCWWCERGGFRTVANHTTKAHGITATDIRNLARVTSDYSIATPEYSAYCKTRPQTLNCEKLLTSNKRHDKPKCYTVEGLRRKRELIKKAREVFIRSGIISFPSGPPKEIIQKAQAIHLCRLKTDLAYYKKWRIALSSTGRDKRIIKNCPICYKPFRTYETSNRKTCGNSQCAHILRSNISRTKNLERVTKKANPIAGDYYKTQKLPGLTALIT